MIDIFFFFTRNNLLSTLRYLEPYQTFPPGWNTKELETILIDVKFLYSHRPEVVRGLTTKSTAENPPARRVNSRWFIASFSR